MKNKLNLLYLWPALGLIGSSLIFLAQGGFGGGHGMDSGFVFFGFPSIYLLIITENLSLAGVLFSLGAFLPIVLLPAVLNASLIHLVISLMKKGVK